MVVDKGGDRPHEDLLADGTKFERRLSLKLSLPNSLEFLTDHKEPSEVFWGIDKLGRSSLYVGEEWSLQWNEKGELRRLYWGGLNLAATQGSLEELVRQPSQDGAKRVRLLRERLSDERLSDLLSDCRELLVCIHDILVQDGYETRGSIPSGEPVADELTRFIMAQLATATLTLAASPG